MKKNQILVGLIALSSILQSQTWLGSASSSGNAYRSGNVGVGNTSPSTVLHVSSTGSTQFLVERTLGQINGLKIFFTSNPAAGISIGGGSSIFQNQAPNNADMLFMPTPNLGALIIKSTGELGIGTNAPSLWSKVSVLNELTPLNVGDNYGTISQLNLVGSGIDWYHGVLGKVTANAGVNGNACGLTGSVNISKNIYSRGVYGIASDAYSTTGGSFYGQKGIVSGYGVEAYGDGTGSGADGIGIYASGSSASGAAWAGYFQGNVYRSGTDNFTSDRKLKNDIKPIESAIDKIMLLKPSVYTFKTDMEFLPMNLPKGKQMGLIAQDLEKVFPELVTEMHEIKKMDMDGKSYTIPSFKSVQYISLIPVLIAGIQEQQKKMEEQAKSNQELKNLVLMQQQQISDLKSQKTNPVGVNSIDNNSDDFKMDQNIPNPFSYETAIKFTLSQNVKNAYLAVYDLSGKQILSFLISERGSSSLIIPGEKLNAGIYIYSIIADGLLMDSKRMVVENKSY